MSAPVEIRERAAVSPRELSAALLRLQALDPIREAAILSTCNRTEVFVVAESGHEDHASLLRHYLAGLHGLPPSTFDGHLYCYRDGAAVTHIMEVASGLDSMMLGEYQIMAQVKEAFAAAQEAGTTRVLLNGLFQSALNTGKKVRTQTEISRGAFSIGAAAVDYATRIFGSTLEKQRVLILGAGKMSELTARHLQSRGASAIFVANRTHERAVELAGQIPGAQARRFDDIAAALVDSDIVICSTAAPHPIVTKPLIQQAMRARRNRPLYIVDIAVPRDVEAAVGQVENVFLNNIDDLQVLVRAAQSSRSAEVDRARAIISDAADEFSNWRRTLEATPLVVAVRERLEALRLDELSRLRTKLGHLPDRDMRVVEQALSSYMNKVAHDATIAIKRSAADPTGGVESLAAIREAFGLNRTESETSERRSEGEPARDEIKLREAFGK